MQEKIYVESSMNNWIHWYFDDEHHYTIRLAGKPSLLLEEFIKEYWEEEWYKSYRDLLIFLNRITEKGKSPFVIYKNNLKS